MVLVSSLPYFHEIVTVKGQPGVADWVPVLGIQALLADAKNNSLGFSSYRVFLYVISIQLFSGLGWLAWFVASKGKRYSLALCVPLVMAVYQMAVILGGLRAGVANTWEVKTGLILCTALTLAGTYARKNSFDARTALKWATITVAAVLPFLHDIITNESGMLRSWVPVLGIEALLTDGEGMVAGFGAYRIFVYFLAFNGYAHLGWLGAFMYYNLANVKPRPFLLVPIIITLYSLALFLLGIEESIFTPDIKFYVTIGLGLLLAWNFFFNDKVGGDLQEKTSTKSNTILNYGSRQVQDRKDGQEIGRKEVQLPERCHPRD